MLGLNNAHANAEHFRRNPDTMTMGRWFRTHGHQTFSVGKIDHTEDYLDPEAWDIRPRNADVRPRPGMPPGSRFREDLPQPDGTALAREFGIHTIAPSADQLHDHAVADEAISFLASRRDRSRPFLAAVGFHSPHVPWQSTAAIHDSLSDAAFRLERLPTDATPLPAGAVAHVPGLAVSDDLQRRTQQAYYAAVSLLDDQVGRVLAALERDGLADRTVVVFTSDHGYHLGWRGQWIKHSISEQVLRVPLIVRLPRGLAGASTDGIVELLDLFPTFCDLAGIPAPAKLDGRSFAPLLRDADAAGKPAAFASMPHMWGSGRTVRTARWRYVERLDGSSELYDHASDPDEYHDVSADPEHAEVIRQHAALLTSTFGARPATRQKPRP
jgi:uncharacterized sulfatase